MDTFISNSPADTESLGEQWGRAAVPGQIFALTGDLGAGKTQLVRGLARGLGSRARVHSPTFAIVNVYDGGRLTLHHLDLYRLETPEALRSAGIDEYLTAEGVVVVEWAERWFHADAREPCGLRVRFVEIETMDETTRRIRYEDSGA